MAPYFGGKDLLVTAHPREVLQEIPCSIFMYCKMIKEAEWGSVPP